MVPGERQVNTVDKASSATNTLITFPIDTTNQEALLRWP
jgi:hypothetical protein